MGLIIVIHFAARDKILYLLGAPVPIDAATEEGVILHEKISRKYTINFFHLWRSFRES